MQAATRERHKAATRNHIADVARRLFLEDGFDEVTLDRVAAESQVSIRTVMRHFETKEQLALCELFDGIREFNVLLEERMRGEDPISVWWKFTSDFAKSDTHGLSYVERLLPFVENVPALHGQLLHLCHQCEQLIAAALAADAGLGEPTLEHRLRAASSVFGTLATLRHLRSANTPDQVDSVWRSVAEFLRADLGRERPPARRRAKHVRVPKRPK